MRLSKFSYINPSIATATGKIILVGMALDGPVQRGFLLEKEQAVSLLGNTELARSYDYLLSSGIPRENVFLYRLNGKHAGLTLSVNDQPFFSFQSVGAADEDNDLSVQVRTADIILRSTYRDEAIASRAKENFERKYTFADYPYMGLLADAINEDAALGLLDIVAKETKEGSTAAYFTQAGTFPLSGATSDTVLCTDTTTEWESYEEIYWPYFYRGVLGPEYTGESASALMGIPAELLYFTDIRSDVSSSIVDYAGRIAEQKTEEQTTLCAAIFHTSPVPAIQTLREGEYMTSANTYYDRTEQAILSFEPDAERQAFLDKLNAAFSEEDKSATHMQYVQIVQGENVLVDGTLIPGASYYASLYLSQSFHEPLGNKQLPLFVRLATELPKSVVASLQANGYICIVPSVRKKFVIPYSQNLALKQGNVLQSFTNQRMLQQIGREISDKLDNYIGLPTTYFPTTRVVKLLEDYLQTFVVSGSLASYDVVVPSNYQSLSRAYIAVTLGVYDEIRQVQANFSMTNEEWEVDVWNLNV